MHEFSVMSYLLDGVEEKARALGAHRILAINLQIGDRATIIDDSLLYYFDAMTPGTLAEGAQLNICRVPMEFYCSHCALPYEPAADFRCPRCGLFGQATEAGGELLVESIEIETGDEA